MNMIAILMMAAKLGTLGFLKIIFFFKKKAYEVMISFQDFTKVLVMWPKFGNYSISMRGLIITSIL